MKRVLVLVLALTVLPLPGMLAELAESATEAAGASQAQQQGQDSSETERGCSVFFHVCSCHGSMSSAPAGTTIRVSTIDAVRGRSFVCQADAATTRNADPPPLPPPIV